MRDLSVDQWVNVAGSALAALVCTTFCVTYHLKATWWRSATGRNLMGLPAAISGLFLYTVLVSLWPDGCFAVVMRGVRTALAVAISLLIAQRIRIMLKAQRESRDRTGV
jgi:ABC-type phosphate transport system permease subunit